MGTPRPHPTRPTTTARSSPIPTATTPKSNRRSIHNHNHNRRRNIHVTTASIRLRTTASATGGNGGAPWCRRRGGPKSRRGAPPCAARSSGSRSSSADLIVLVVYLVYRPHNPRFEVSDATLNAAYLDAGSLLNADVSVLANFTNPNRKVGVDFGSLIVDLYYGSTLIATQFIQPFSASRAGSRFVNLELVTSQVRIPLEDSKKLEEEIEKNTVTFNVKGVFRVRSKLGTFLGYSYKLYGHCTIVTTGPPSGILRGRRCITKR
ncbi:unnamed protein product [Linum tenue]|uniref:Late embryogenesis abundant protein LEA-2 subgroup domain-containing protein n=1 Tax=Linum tenue TaxID=586396 RepID=A0AAV0HY41_9ROSI|nr:unnamed protein product [Linum tenue]